MDQNGHQWIDSAVNFFWKCMHFPTHVSFLWGSAVMFPPHLCVDIKTQLKRKGLGRWPYPICLVSSRQSPAFPWLSRVAVDFASDGKEPGKGIFCVPLPRSYPVPMLVLCCGTGSASLGCVEMPQKPKGQTRLGPGEWHGKTMEALLQSYLLVGKIKLLYPGWHSRACPGMLCHGRSKDMLREEEWQGKV